MCWDCMRGRKNTPEEQRAKDIEHSEAARLWWHNTTQEDRDRINARRRERRAAMSPEEKSARNEKQAVKRREEYAANREAVCAAARERYRKNPNKRVVNATELDRIKWLLAASRKAAKKNGDFPCLTPAEEILALRQYRCANPACDQIDSPESRLHLDHDHRTGRFRGWLCSACNTALGCLRDDKNRLVGLKAYLLRVNNARDVIVEAV